MLPDFVQDALSNAVGEVCADLFGQSPQEWLEQRAMQTKIRRAVSNAEQQFARSYQTVDPELVAALTQQTRFADLPSVRTALRDLLSRPFHDPSHAVAVLRRSFDDVLPAQTDRSRVDRAMQAFLAALGNEVLYIPELRELYALHFARISAESGRTTAVATTDSARQLAIIADGIQGLQTKLQALSMPVERPLLSSPIAPARPRPWHNLPQRNYVEFIGRQDERATLTRLLLPHPHSRHFVITIDGIGGVGKSTLALELAHRYREQYTTLPETERFDAIIWISAKRTLLTASGIQQRRQTFNTLDDLFREVATVLEQPAILQAGTNERRRLVEHALSTQRVLLIVDNLETVDDEELLTFLRELPDPTKAIVTTRHRIDIAYAIRLSGMPRADALSLMQVESEAKGVHVTPAEMDDLERRTGGVPLAIQWSIGLMSLGHSVEAVLRRLSQGQNDIARFCFEESAAHLRGRDAHRLLLALALFERSVNRTMLGEVATLHTDPIGRDDGLADLLRLSLVNQKQDRFKLLPLTHAFARHELTQHPELEQELRGRWVEVLSALAQPFNVVHWQQPDRSMLRLEGEHLESFVRWAEAQERLDLVLAISPALSSYYDAVGRWRDMIDLNERSIAYARLLDDPAALRNELNWLAWTINQQGRYDEAEQAYTEALSLAAQIGDPIWRVEILVNMAQLARRRDQPEQAHQYCAEALEILPQIDPTQRAFVHADILIEQGKLDRDLSNWEQAQIAFQQAREVFRIDLNNPAFNLERAWGAYSQFAYVAHQRGNLDEAARMYAESVDALREVGSRGYLATVLIRFAQLEVQRGNPQAAHGYAKEALEYSRRLGLTPEQDQAAELVAQLGGNLP